MASAAVRVGAQRARALPAKCPPNRLGRGYAAFLLLQPVRLCRKRPDGLSGLAGGGEGGRGRGWRAAGARSERGERRRRGHGGAEAPRPRRGRGAESSRQAAWRARPRASAAASEPSGAAASTCPDLPSLLGPPARSTRAPCVSAPSRVRVCRRLQHLADGPPGRCLRVQRLNHHSKYTTANMIFNPSSIILKTGQAGQTGHPLSQVRAIPCRPTMPTPRPRRRHQVATPPPTRKTNPSPSVAAAPLLSDS